MQITKSAVDQLTAGFIWDGELKGFGCRTQGKGKHYVLKYRVGHRQRWYTIGRHGSPWTPASARIEAKRLLGEIAAGRDPAVERERHQSYMLRDAVPPYLEHVKARRKASTHDLYARVLNAYALPAIGKHRLLDVTSADIAKLHDSMNATPSQANLTVRVLSALFQWAGKRGLVPKGFNPCKDAVEKYDEQPRERYLTIEEFKRLGAALDQFRDVHPYVVHAVGLLALTGARKNEILTLKWEYVDTAQGVLRLPDSKTGAKVIYLNAAALGILNATPRLDNNPYVMPGAKAGEHLKLIAKPWDKIRKAAGLPDLRMHDLRHSFASLAAGKGMSLHMIGAMLGHKDMKSTRRYAHLAHAPMLDASNMVGSAIAAVMIPENILQEAA
jgi:integrase